MKIKLNSVYVEDQDKALKFYTEVLGFVKFGLNSLRILCDFFNCFFKVT